ncbi:MAG: glucokinase [Nitrospinota bacterium]|nr:glucokinase [Nitrospinota bacterium]
MRTILAGDIGGTKALLAIFEERNGSFQPIEEACFASADYKGLSGILNEFLDQTGANIASACLGVPGPVIGGTCRTTHHGWLIDIKEIKSQLAIGEIFLINDMAALAHAVPFLSKSQFEILQIGQPEETSNIALIAAGTGLGQAFLLKPDENELIVLSSEGGHCDFAPRTELEIELLRFLLKKYKRVSVERVLSGYGLFHIYQFINSYHSFKEPDWLTKEFGEKDPAAVITGNIAKSPACEKALNLFISIYGAVSGSLALQMLAGVYLGGGIAPKIISKLKEGDFMEAFLAKGRFQDLLSRIPVHVIMDDKAALLGAARYAHSRTSG